ncbi:hypothetical protein TKK_0003914 [Trichogramma kaykai]|uniref:Uncharacterized protein n=1 Tax=Trichogramma kaykai TaxID=54128 RepID=A0ABD2XQJ0_9HYME
MCKVVGPLSVQSLLALVVVLLLLARGHEGSDMQLQHEIELEHLGQATNEIPREEKELVRDDVAEHERKLMLECQHSDYRMYIKCLKRDKRQQFHRVDQQQQQQQGQGRSSCLDQCFQVNCTSSACIRDCHSHCRQKLIETYSKTIETSYDCQDNECKERDGDEDAVKHANHTTIVNVNNNINLTTSNCSSSAQDKDKSSRTIGYGSGLDDGEAGGSRRNFSEALIPKIELNNIITNQFGGAPGSSGGYGSPDGPCACPGCNCGGYNVWPQIPQITIGIGGGGGPMQPGGCIVPMSWPCFQQRYPLSYPQQPQQQQQQQSLIDCSQCANPFLRYQCDPACYSGGGVVDVKYNATGAPVSNPLPQQQQQQQQQQQSYPRLTPRTWNNGIR